MTDYTRAEILANREKWIAFLEVPSRRKAKAVLDAGDGKRCCLGHGCYVLGVKKSKNDNEYSKEEAVYLYGEEDDAYAPQQFVDMVGLTDNGGSFDPKDFDGEEYSGLVELNDGSAGGGKGYSPQFIAKYLRSVIKGGEGAPFKPLEDYPV